jgi:hypothetical protein
MDVEVSGEYEAESRIGLSVDYDEIYNLGTPHLFFVSGYSTDRSVISC